MGKAALDGLPGVLRVQSGWHGREEANTVDYDPARITVEEMETALKLAGTWKRTLRE